MLETEKQQFLIDHLAESASDFTALIAGFDPAHWSTRPSPDRWSVAEIAEHVLVIDTRVSHFTMALSEWPEENYDAEQNTRKDRLVLSVAENRTTRIEAPEQVRPTGTLSLTEFLVRFPESQARLTRVATESGELLRGRFKQHPVLEKLDGYQWLLACSCHRRRHINQIEEVKSAILKG